MLEYRGIGARKTRLMGYFLPCLLYCFPVFLLRLKHILILTKLKVCLGERFFDVKNNFLEEKKMLESMENLLIYVEIIVIGN